MNDKAERAQVRRLLWRWGRVLEYCARRQKELDEKSELIECIGDIGAREMTGMPRGNEVLSPTERCAVNMMRRKEQYADRMHDLREEIEDEQRFSDAIDGIMSVLNKTEFAVMEYRYKRQYLMGEIANKFNYSIAQIENIEGGAIDKISEYLAIETKD